MLFPSASQEKDNYTHIYTYTGAVYFSSSHLFVWHYITKTSGNTNFRSSGYPVNPVYSCCVYNGSVILKGRSQKSDLADAWMSR